jgi:ribosomal protein L21E
MSTKLQFLSSSNLQFYFRTSNLQNYIKYIEQYSVPQTLAIQVTGQISESYHGTTGPYRGNIGVTTGSGWGNAQKCVILICFSIDYHPLKVN